MANSTKYLLAEQVQTRLAGGFRDANQPVQNEDIVKAIEQIINSMFQSTLNCKVKFKIEKMKILILFLKKIGDKEKLLLFLYSKFDDDTQSWLNDSVGVFDKLSFITRWIIRVNNWIVVSICFNQKNRR